MGDFYFSKVKIVLSDRAVFCTTLKTVFLSAGDFIKTISSWEEKPVLPFKKIPNKESLPAVTNHSIWKRVTSKNCYIFLSIIARLGVTAYTHTLTCRIHFKVLQKSLKTWHVYCALGRKTTLSHQCHTRNPRERWVLKVFSRALLTPFWQYLQILKHFWPRPRSLQQ